MTKPPNPSDAYNALGAGPPPPPLFGINTGAAGQAKQKQNKGGFGSTVLGAGDVSNFSAGVGQKTLLGQ